MDQLVVLQEIYASFSKGVGPLKKIDIMAIEGCCSDLVGQLLEGSINGRIEEDICRELCEKLTDVYELKRLGDICRQAGLIRLATDTYKRAILLCHDPVLRPVLQNNLGQAYAGQGDMNRALSCYQEAANIFSREGDRTGLAHVLGNLGSAYRKAGEWNRAIEHAHRSLKIFEEDEDSLGIAQMTGSIGRIYADMGERELAARYFERSLADFQRLGDKRGAAWILDRLGRIAREGGAWDRALGYMHSSISIWEEMGESAGLGAVLTDLGSTLLQMGQPSAARSPLERAVLLVPEHSRPNYQRALCSLARAYSSLAEDSMKEALKADDSGIAFQQEKRKEASRLFSRSADRYQELAATLFQRKMEIKARAALARSRSYLSRIYEQTPDREALLLAEKAMAALDNAAANSNDEKKARILVLQRIIAGLCQAYRTHQLAGDPQEIRASLSGCADYLMEAAGSCVSRVVGDLLYQALMSIDSGIKTEMSASREDKRREAACALRQANRQYRIAENEDADAISRMIDRAAEILVRPEDISNRGERAEGQIHEGQERGSYSSAWDKERSALLAVAGSMMIYTLRDLEKHDEMPSLDDSPQLPDRDRKETEGIFAEIAQEDDLSQVPDREALAGSDRPDRCGRKEGETRDLVLADGSLEVKTAIFSAVEESPKRRKESNDPGQAFRKASQLLLSEERPPLERDLFRPLAGAEAYAGREERFGVGDKPGREVEEEAERAEIIQPFAESPGQSYDQTIRKEEAPDPGIEDAGPQLSRGGDDLEMEREAQALSPRMVLALKVMSALVLLLLLIEMMLYLI